MSIPAIHIENLWKQYRLGAINHGTLTRDIQSWWARKRGKEDPNSKVQANRKHIEGETLWALQDINLDIAQGELIGIIGKNGAGKSTLLKILSKITTPTRGFIGINGHLASLLEVGTGFHPELTGKENIYLNGAIMGLDRAEVRKRYDAIAEFSEIADFLDTPVKRYSSGMYVRLGFAVAAHLDPDILIVDEVLAVGDIDFQKKCLGKLQNVAGEGRTVLFVSHNMESITQLCNRGILLEKGSIVADGPIDEIVSKYQRKTSNSVAERLWEDAPKAPGNDIVHLVGVRAQNRHGEVSNVFSVRDSVRLEMDIKVKKPGHILNCMFIVSDDKGRVLFVTGDFQNPDLQDAVRSTGTHRSWCTIPADFLNSGQIHIRAMVRTNRYVLHFKLEDALILSIVDSDDMNGARGNLKGQWYTSAVRPRLEWGSTIL